MKPMGKMRPVLVNDPKDSIAIFNRVRYDSDGHEIVYLVKIDVLALDLMVDTVEPFYSAENICRNFIFFQQLFKNFFYCFNLFLCFFPTRLYQRGHLEKLVWCDITKR